MAPIKFLLAMCSLAIFSATLNATPANALSVEGHHVNRHVAHDSVAKRKRGQSSRCKPRGTSSSSPSPSSSPAKSITPPPSSPLSSSPGHKPSSTSSTPAVVTTPANPGSGSKLGLAWAVGDDARLKLLKPSNGEQRFLYTWSPTFPKSARALGFTPVPQLWGDKQINSFTQNVVAGYATHVMGFNEPNQSGQSDMSPEHGAYLWKTYIQPLKAQGYTLVSPATTSAPDGLTWVQNMLKACGEGQCTFDIIALHWYDTTFEKFQTYVELWHNTFGLPIWITEFACQNFNSGPQPSNSDIWSFYGQATAWLEKTDYVESWMPFGFMGNMDNVNPADSLFSDNGLSDLGWMIANVGK